MTDPHLCQDCNQPATDSLCPSCAQWREHKFAKLDEEWQDKLARRKRFRPLSAMSGADFGEACADMVKAVERSKG